MTRHLLLWLTAFVAVAQAASAQQPLLPGGGLGISAVAQSVHFQTPLLWGNGVVQSVEQAVVPLTVRVPVADAWAVEVSGAYTYARVQSNADRRDAWRELLGPTDTRVRVSGPVVRDALLLNVTVNVPTGLVGLDDEQFAVLQAIAAPALSMPAPVLGGGLGVTGGAVIARRVAGWAVALGGSYEVRTRFTPVEAALIGAVVNAKLTPAAVTRMSLAATRAFGAQEVTLLAGLDRYGSDLVEATIEQQPTSIRYRLGALRSMAGSWRVTPRFAREVALSAAYRRRGLVVGPTGNHVEGSSGDYLDLDGRVGWGSPRRAGIEIGGHVRSQSGLPFEEALATAAMRSAGASIALRLPSSGAVWRLVGRYELGRVRSGAVDSPFTCLSAMLSIAPRNR